MLSKILSGIAILMGGLALYFSVSGKTDTEKTAYINIKEVFDGFAMKKELQTKFEQTAEAKKQIIDSLEIQLKKMSMQLQDAPKPSNEMMIDFELKREEYFKKKEEFEQTNAQMSMEYDKQILEQLSQYIKDFGKEKNYTFIYGATDAGNIMYGEEGKNITKEVISYINKKYSGK